MKQKTETALKIYPKQQMQYHQITRKKNKIKQCLTVRKIDVTLCYTNFYSHFPQDGS